MTVHLLEIQMVSFVETDFWHKTWFYEIFFHRILNFAADIVLMTSMSSSICVFDM